jgi:hypothetical protein
MGKESDRVSSTYNPMHVQTHSNLQTRTHANPDAKYPFKHSLSLVHTTVVAGAATEVLCRAAGLPWSIAWVRWRQPPLEGLCDCECAIRARIVT